MNPAQASGRDAAAMASVFRRMDEIAVQCGDRFPLFRLGGEVAWTLSRRGSWLGGFWAALWWRRAACTGSAADLAQARQWSARLQPWLAEPSIHRSFIFWYGTAFGHQLFHGEQAAGPQATQAAQAIAADFDIRLGGWALGTGMGAGAAGLHCINIDALAPTLALLHHYGGPAGGELAHRHLQTAMRHLATAHGAWRANAFVEPDGAVPQELAGAWSRGQAWAMLGMAQAVRCFGAAYRDAALQACTYWCQHWGAQALGAGQDLSAQAIACVAMLELHAFTPDQVWLQQQAQTQLARLLARDEVVDQGRFVGHLYRVDAYEEQLVESACATFFLQEALLRLAGRG